MKKNNDIKRFVKAKRDLKKLMEEIQPYIKRKENKVYSSTRGDWKSCCDDAEIAVDTD